MAFLLLLLLLFEFVLLHVICFFVYFVTDYLLEQFLKAKYVIMLIFISMLNFFV